MQIYSAEQIINPNWREQKERHEMTGNKKNGNKKTGNNCSP